MVAWRTTNLASTLPQNLWEQNFVAGKWLRLGNLVPQILTIILVKNCRKLSRIILKAITSLDTTAASFTTTFSDVSICYFYYYLLTAFSKALFVENHV